ncbi:cytochrome P450 4V2-like [Uloborus diversus]|uniref:cytochrome P450 4V2-like n=1 Tax=Uloborus diversus TaxID=327109 RepID=UPI002409FF42|nr:cytochrome P450 4V2-like [Uloborus diversus]
MRPHVVLYKAELIKTLINHPQALDKASSYSLLECMFAGGLLTSNGEKWRRRRKLITPTFHLEILRSYLGIFNEQSMIFLEKLKELPKEPYIEVDNLLGKYSVDIVCDSAMGLKVSGQKGSDLAENYFHAYHECGKIFVHRILRPWTNYDALFFHCFPKGRALKKFLDVLRSFTKKVINEKRESLLQEESTLSGKSQSKEFSQLPRKRKSFLELLLEFHLKDPDFSLDDIQEEVDTFMGAGHDTSAITSRWILFMLGMYPEIQEKVINELDNVFKGDAHRKIAYEDLNNMKYTECVIKETLRLFPPLPFVGREVHTDVNVGPYTIPGGSVAIFNVYMLHRDSEIFPNPEKFDPDRFIPDNCKYRHPYAFIPFSAGPRNCIGQRFAMTSLKVLIANILRNFRVFSVDQRDQIPLTWEITLTNIKPIRLRLIPRSVD